MEISHDILQYQITQKLASDPHESSFLYASAGSGKTRTLVARILRLLLEKNDPRSIYCITYTKAATAEIMDRVAKIGSQICSLATAHESDLQQSKCAELYCTNAEWNGSKTDIAEKIYNLIGYNSNTTNICNKENKKDKDKDNDKDKDKDKIIKNIILNIHNIKTLFSPKRISQLNITTLHGLFFEFLQRSTRYKLEEFNIQNDHEAQQKIRAAYQICTQDIPRELSENMPKTTRADNDLSEESTSSFNSYEPSLLSDNQQLSSLSRLYYHHTQIYYQDLVAEIILSSKLKFDQHDIDRIKKIISGKIASGYIANDNHDNRKTEERLHNLDKSHINNNQGLGNNLDLQNSIDHQANYNQDIDSICEIFSFIHKNKPFIAELIDMHPERLNIILFCISKLLPLPANYISDPLMIKNIKINENIDAESSSDSQSEFDPNIILQLDSIFQSNSIYLRKCAGYITLDAIFSKIKAKLLTKTGEIRKCVINNKRHKKNDDCQSNGMQSIINEFSNLIYNNKKNKYISFLQDFYNISVSTSDIYNQMKSNLKTYDYSDIINNGVALLNTDGIDSLLDAPLQHILIDEMQDLSESQWHGIFALIQHFWHNNHLTNSSIYPSIDPFSKLSSSLQSSLQTTSDAIDNASSATIKSSYYTIFAVGDYKQSIYGFQGASPKFAKHAEKYLREKIEKHWKKKLFHLQMTLSFRSHPIILAHIDQICNRKNYLEAFDAGIIKHHAAITNRKDDNNLILINIDQLDLNGNSISSEGAKDCDKKRGQLGDDKKDDASAASINQRIAKRIVNEILKELEEYSPTPNIMILLRNRNDLFRNIINFLIEFDIPTIDRQSNMGSYYAFINAFIHLCNIAYDPHNDTVFAAFLESIGMKIDGLWMKEICANRDELSIYDAIIMRYHNKYSMTNINFDISDHGSDRPEYANYLNLLANELNHCIENRAALGDIENFYQYVINGNMYPILLASISANYHQNHRQNPNSSDTRGAFNLEGSMSNIQNQTSNKLCRNYPCSRNLSNCEIFAIKYLRSYIDFFSKRTLCEKYPDYSISTFASFFSNEIIPIHLDDNLNQEDAIKYVNISTIHGAKGLEADTVIFVDAQRKNTHKDNFVNLYEACFLRNKLCPIDLDDPEIKQEELRLKYVAYTRARNKLIVLSSDKES